MATFNQQDQVVKNQVNVGNSKDEAWSQNKPTEAGWYWCSKSQVKTPSNTHLVKLAFNINVLVDQFQGGTDSYDAECWWLEIDFDELNKIGNEPNNE